MTAPTAPRTEAERAAWKEIVVDAYLLGWNTRNNGQYGEDASAYAERVVPPVAPRRVPPSVTLSDGSVMEYRKGEAKPWVRSFSDGHRWTEEVLRRHVITDDDLAACLALRDAPPTDPVREAAKNIVADAMDGALPADELVSDILALIDQHAARPSHPCGPMVAFQQTVERALHEAYEAGKSDCTRGGWAGTTAWRERIVQAALDLLDIDQHAAPALTAEECVARLVALGVAKPLEGKGCTVHGSVTQNFGAGVVSHLIYAPAPERAP